MTEERFKKHEIEHKENIRQERKGSRETKGKEQLDPSRAGAVAWGCQGSPSRGAVRTLVTLTAQGCAGCHPRAVCGVSATLLLLRLAFLSCSWFPWASPCTNPFLDAQTEPAALGGPWNSSILPILPTALFLLPLLPKSQTLS